MQASIFCFTPHPLEAAASKPALLIFVTTVGSDCSPDGDTPALLRVCSENEIPHLSRTCLFCVLICRLSAEMCSPDVWVGCCRETFHAVLILAAQVRGRPEGPARCPHISA